MSFVDFVTVTILEHQFGEVGETAFDTKKRRRHLLRAAMTRPRPQYYRSRRPTLVSAAT